MIPNPEVISRSILKPELVPSQLRKLYSERYAGTIRIWDRYRGIYEFNLATEKIADNSALAERRDQKINRLLDSEGWLGQLEPEFLLAWQEGLLRPVSWPVKSRIINHLRLTREQDISTALKRELIYVHTATMSNNGETKFWAAETVPILHAAIYMNRTREMLVAIHELLTGTELDNVSEQGFIQFKSEMLEYLNDDTIRAFERGGGKKAISEDLDRLRAEYIRTRPKRLTEEEYARAREESRKKYEMKRRNAKADSSK